MRKLINATKMLRKSAVKGLKQITITTIPIRGIRFKSTHHNKYHTAGGARKITVLLK